MRDKTKGFIAGVMVCVVVMLLSATTFAVSQSITVDPIKIMVDGTIFQPKDVNGNDVLVFAYKGTTYAPLRALAEAYGLEVGYDSSKNMATVSKPGNAETQPSSAPVLSDEKYYLECYGVPDFGKIFDVSPLEKIIAEDGISYVYLLPDDGDYGLRYVDIYETYLTLNDFSFVKSELPSNGSYMELYKSTKLGYGVAIAVDTVSEGIAIAIGIATD